MPEDHSVDRHFVFLDRSAPDEFLFKWCDINLQLHMIINYLVFNKKALIRFRRKIALFAAVSTSGLK